MATYCAGGTHNAQVTDDVLGARKTPNMGDACAAAPSEAAFEDGYRTVFVNEKRAEDEINVDPLPGRQKKLFTRQKGSMWKEWAETCAAGPGGAKAIQVHRGAAAADIYRKCPQPIIPSRWRHKWKDKGADYGNGLSDPSAQKNYDA